MKSVSVIVAIGFFFSFSEVLVNMKLVSSFEMMLGIIDICPHPDQNITENISEIKMGLEYLPEYNDNPCVVKDPLWEMAECPGFETASQYVLSDWTNKKNKKITLSEYGYFSMIHSGFNNIIEATLRGEKVYFPSLKKWAGKKKLKSLDLWLKPVPDRTIRFGKDDSQRMLKKCVGINDRDSINSVVRFVAMSQLMHTLLKPKKYIEDRVKARKRKLDWNENDKVVGLYVRRGDSCEASEMERTKRLCDDLVDYMDDIKRVTEKYSITKIYLLSDGGDYIYNQTEEFPEYQWFYDSTTPHDEMLGTVEQRLGKGDLDGEAEGTQMLVDFFTLVSSHVLVGKLTSNVFRGALEYKSGQMKSRVPFVSLDAPWCFCYACYGKVEKGFFKGDEFHC